ncbi:glycerate kinase [Paenibacillus glucanolyticus]|jgi:glycerate kinase|uniref:glycerate kinase n=1 Tax=Paenibacillus TaxID=44249 RepID=UPI0003E200C2|nr:MULTISPECIES: glycerate kinase [Paenibacillus]ANA79966.1 glycerate kinase [Paenibacillus glucanolyticus]AVV56008.1 glycerate kinase [Paenibacillus glucanolyticus]ETT38352.1 glycerate kinase [Paenibacillus sp. FSL R5-808]
MKQDYVIVLAPDSFKESMTAKEVCEAMERGILKANPNVTCIHVPMADGGEGTMQSLVDATGGTVHTAMVTGPLGNQVEASYGISGDGSTGVLEMASASGIHLVPPAERNPLVTTTYGTGELIKACLDHGVSRLLIGIGGSATNDGGAGVVQALGGKLLDAEGKELAFGGGDLGRLASFDLTGLDSRLQHVEVEVACDVTNPLCGETGASHVFGPQKGATPDMIEQLDSNLRNYAGVMKQQLGKDIVDYPGAGAAGGLGGGLMVFLNGTLKKGIDMVVDYTGLEEKVRQADMVWTGEGGMDFQTQYGKTPLGVAMVAKKHGKPVVALAGRIGDGIEVLYDKGMDAIFGIMPGAATLSEALVNGQQNVERTSENIVRLMNSLNK